MKIEIRYPGDPKHVEIKDEVKALLNGTLPVKSVARVEIILQRAGGFTLALYGHQGEFLTNCLY